MNGDPVRLDYKLERLEAEVTRLQQENERLRHVREGALRRERLTYGRLRAALDREIGLSDALDDAYRRIRELEARDD